MLALQPQLIVDISLYKIGRTGPICGEWYGCPCKASPEASQGWDCRILLGGQTIHLGETKRLGIVFLSPTTAVPLFRKLGTFYLWEGRIIGEAKVVS